MKEWLKNHGNKAAPYILTGVVTLTVNMFVQASGVSDECRAEIQSYCARVIAAFLGN